MMATILTAKLHRKLEEAQEVSGVSLDVLISILRNMSDRTKAYLTDKELLAVAEKYIEENDPAYKYKQAIRRHKETILARGCNGGPSDELLWKVLEE